MQKSLLIGTSVTKLGHHRVYYIITDHFMKSPSIFILSPSSSESRLLRNSYKYLNNSFNNVLIISKLGSKIHTCNYYILTSFSISYYVNPFCYYAITHVLFFTHHSCNQCIFNVSEGYSHYPSTFYKRSKINM